MLPTPIDPTLDLFAEIARLKRELNAIILAHYYQDPDIQEIADVIGDSLALAMAARKTGARCIVFCGVRFMAETAKILSPDALVLVPDPSAECSLADSCPSSAFERFVRAHEIESVAQVVEVLDAGAGAVLLDNMSPGDVAKAVRLVRSHPRGATCWIEASGGITLANVRAYAEAGVDTISVGALTHSAPSVDIALDLASQ